MSEEIKVLGRPTKLTPQLQERIIADVSIGVPIARACAANGIDKQTYYNWIKRGEHGDEIYKIFLDLVKKAENDLIKDGLTTIKSGRHGWQGSAWILERRFWGDFGRRSPIESVDGQPVQVVFNVSSTEAKIASDSLFGDDSKLLDE